VFLLQGERLARLEELHLVFASDIRDSELALVLTMCPRTLRRLCVAAFVVEYKCEETAGAIGVLLQECPRLKTLELVIEPLMRSFQGPLQLDKVETLKLMSSHSLASCLLLQEALQRTQSLRELSLSGLCSGEGDEEITKGLALVVDAASPTLVSLTIAFFPGFAVSSAVLTDLGNAVAKCRLERFCLLGRIGEEGPALFADAVAANAPTLQELSLSCRFKSIEALARVKSFPVLRRLHICGLRKIRASDFELVAKVACGPHLTHLIVESESVAGDVGDEALLSPAVVHAIASLPNLE
jgi:hypothetical protein